ncbi:hypothetical protein [Paraburkholderia aromaticivorans]|uniref:hypothetical protein n=1 Tax=Paraburkholderia aromaticivorans TaxID=2026199 RepID=UPI0038BDA5EC
MNLERYGIPAGTYTSESISASPDFPGLDPEAVKVLLHTVIHEETQAAEPSPVLHNPLIFVDDEKEVKEVGSPLLLSLLKRI